MAVSELAQGFEMPPDGGWIGRWSPVIGDPTIMGWLTVALYLFGAWQCYRVTTLHTDMLRSSESIIWWILVYGLLALGINKQLDLQSAFTELGRILATEQGWYDKRHKVQAVFIYGVASFAVLAAFILSYVARKAPLATLFSLAGCICLLAFVFIRAASFHHFDLYINSVTFGLKMNWILEMGGICVIIAGARWRFQIR